VLLAAFDACRPTNDVDLAGLNLANDTGAVLELLRSVLVVEPTALSVQGRVTGTNAQRSVILAHPAPTATAQCLV
jgi:hypothetical protein